MTARVFGLETEYGLTCVTADGAELALEVDEAAELLFAPIVARRQTTNAYLSNGGRLYLDVGAHPEYASAECSLIGELIAQDRAGDELLRDLLQQADARLERRGVSAQIHLFKNNHDAMGHSFGCHENYLLRRRREYKQSVSRLIPFFVTRQILVGAGGFVTDSEGVRFEVSQRATQIWDSVSTSTTRSRPMINTRDEPLGDAESYRRMHVIVGDSNMCEPTLALKVGMVLALLAAIEAGAPLPRLELVDPVAAIREVSLDLTGSARIALADGSQHSAVEIQRIYFDYVMQARKRPEMMQILDSDPYFPYVFDLWDRALRAFETQDFRDVDTEIEWIAKLKFFRLYARRSELTWGEAKLQRLDLAWHDLAAQGLRDRLEAAGVLRRLGTDEVVQRAKTTPPQTTRARVRGEFIRAAQELRRDFEADWTTVRLYSAQGAKQILLNDPFETHNAAVKTMMETMVEQ